MSDALRTTSSRNDLDVGRVVGEAPASAPDGRRWTSLIFIALAQLMVALDATIVSIALPSAQSALHVADAERQWVITAYTLAFGGLLLLGGRIGDQLGRKRTFVLGLAGFAVASALGGSALNFGMLIGARALQGAFAALLTPTALSLLAVTFTEPRERAKAFAVYGSIAGSGAAVGLLLGGVLTQYFSWRWCLFVNLPIAVIAAVGGWMVLSDTGAPRRGRLDIAGVAFASGGLVALVFACTDAVTQGWGSAIVIGALVVSAVLLTVFVIWQRHATNPLLPLRIVADRNRGGSYLAVLLTIAGMFGAFLFLTYYMQVVLGYSPLQAGLAFLPDRRLAVRFVGDRQPADATCPRESPDGPRLAGCRRRHGATDAAAGRQRFCFAHPPRRGAARGGYRLRDGACVQHRHPRCRSARGRRRRRDCQYRITDRRIHRDGAAQHHRRECNRGVLLGPRAWISGSSSGSRPWLFGGHGMGDGDLHPGRSDRGRHGQRGQAGGARLQRMKASSAARPWSGRRPVGRARLRDALRGASY